jgi:TPP-dependent trihydroxycyclohexane-1,2-dione (THcHDO) dehydratase
MCARVVSTRVLLSLEQWHACAQTRALTLTRRLARFLTHSQGTIPCFVLATCAYVCFGAQGGGGAGDGRRGRRYIHHTIDAICERGLQFITVHNEQAAALAADGWARLKGRPGASVAISGPGGINLLQVQCLPSIAHL